jgi:hypothetical protein
MELRFKKIIMELASYSEEHSLKMAQGVCSLRSTETQCFISGCGGTKTCETDTPPPNGTS